MRRLLVAEGDLFQINSTLSAAGLSGDVSAQVRWNDGNVTSADTVVGGNATGPLRIRFDYSLDTNNFFGGANQSRRALLQFAADSIIKRFTDDLDAITPAGKAEWQPAVFHPSSGPSNSIAGTLVNVTKNMRVAANEIVIFAGARDLPGSTHGVGGTGSVFFPAASNLTPQELAQIEAFRQTALGRGEPGATTSPQTDVAPWGGSVSFDTNANWYFGLDASNIAADQTDFVTIASHEIAHVLGFGISRTGVTSSWDRLVSGNSFTGAKARAAYQGNGNVPLQSSGDHWAQNTAQPTAMTPFINPGGRELFSTLDFAAMDDIGWDVVNMNTSVTAQHRYADDGLYPVEVVLRGSRGGETVHQVTTANVTNVNPTLTVVGNQAITVGQTLSLTDLGIITDPGTRNSAASPATAETFEYSINWGDGTVDSAAATIDAHGNIQTGADTTASFNGLHQYESTGTYTVQVSVTDDDGGQASRSFRVTVHPMPEISLSLSQSSVSEDAGLGGAVLTVTLSGAPSDSTRTVLLSSNDPTEVQVQSSIIIAAGETSAEVPLSIVDDQELDGTINVGLTATGEGLVSGTTHLAVTDAESLVVSFTNPTVDETNSQLTRLHLLRSNTSTDPLTVNVSGGIPGRLELPSTLTIPANSRVLLYTLVPVDDKLSQAPADATFTITAPGYESGSGSVALIDDESPAFQNASNPFDVNNNSAVTANDALRVINEVGRRDGDTILDPSLEQPNGSYWDVSGDYRLTARDALLVINQLTRNSNKAQGEHVADKAAGDPVAGPIVAPIDQNEDDDEDWLELLASDQALGNR